MTSVATTAVGPPRVAETPSPLARRVGLLGTENAFKIGPLIAEVEAAGHRVIRCNLGEPDFPLPRHIREEVERQLEADLTHYCDPQGLLPLREAIARDMGSRRGIVITPERVVVFPGAKPPIGLCQEAYCNPGDEVIYPSPGFPIYESFTRYSGARPVPLPLQERDGFSFTGAELERLITRRTKLIILNFPSNPTGGVASRAQLEGIAEAIRRRARPDVRVYSDEVYEHIVFDGAVHHSIASLPEMQARTVITSGVSKTYAWTGGRVGWAVFPTPQEAAVFKNLNINYFSCVPPYNQMGAKLAIESPESPPEIRRMVAAFQERRNRVVEALNAIPGITCQMPKGAFYAFPNIGGACEAVGAVAAHRALPVEIRHRTSPSTLFQLFLLFRHQVATMDRRSFGQIGSEGQHFLRISVATGMDDLQTAMERLRVAAQDERGFAAFVKTEARLF
jgi:aspartate/methionine/tyrosine aminotransferase